MFKFVSTKNINELFQRAILHNDIQRTRLILEEAMKDPRFNIDQINEEGLTALQYSCFAGNVEIVKILTAYGANWKIRDRDGYTLMHASAMAGNGAVMRFLIQLGLKPVLKTDDGNMPIDVTDEISIIVILLRSMLDQGFLQEMQDYMLDHPKLKRKIFKELEKVKCREQEKVEILNEMPYTSHTVPRQKALDKAKKSKSREGVRRSTSTFSELSDSIQALDKVEAFGFTDMNNNECGANDAYACPRSEVYIRASEPDTDTLKRENSFSSSSSHSSKSSHRSNSGAGGILRHGNRQDHHDVDNAYRNTQQYLESRFPAVSSRPKSVTFEFDNELMNNRKYSDCHPSNNYNENSSMSSQPQPSSQSNVINLKPVSVLDEPLYENAASARLRAKLSNTENPNKIYPQISQKQVPPPLPPRAPTTQLSDGLRLNHVSYINNRTYEENYISDRQLGSETDSGIDVNETAGRMFALSVNDRREEDTYNRSVSYQNENYSKPNGMYYSEQFKGPLARQRPPDDHGPPCSFAVRKTYDNPKYRSWNGRSFHEDETTPYNSHYRNTRTNDNFYDTRYSQTPSESAHAKVSGSVPNISEGNYQTGSVHKNIEPIDFSRYDFDNQPEIML